MPRHVLSLGGHVYRKNWMGRCEVPCINVCVCVQGYLAGFCGSGGCIWMGGLSVSTVVPGEWGAATG